MPVSADLDKLLDKAFESSTLEEVLSAPPSALAGLTERHDEALKVLGISSIADMGTNKYFLAAQAMAALGT